MNLYAYKPSTFILQAVANETYNYLKTRLENLQTSEACPICLETTCIQDIAITKCGHKFCWDCLYQTHKSKESTSTIIKCPSCNTLISNKEVYLLFGSRIIA